MRRHLSDMHFADRIHLPHAHAIRIHPSQWVEDHPAVTALLVTGLIALLLIGLVMLAGRGIGPRGLPPFDYRMAPFGIPG